ncbi:DUF3416 domain-containing protein [Corynebacterium sp. sy017]|uniref:maltotransferase domain-containing protein n=1 Tax=Corynebacterium sp. SY003 TaxID=2499164 RepID=UPI001184D3A2|nr:DUF3416 domain-containing protein [Corynebacterium sp. sy017]TSD91348.1 DUF3416 domain-containing protein [Corynebacterium sp. SY003]
MSTQSPSLTSFPRLAIDDIHPTIAHGTVAAKAVVGEYIPISALIWREGHDCINATLRITPPADSTRDSTELTQSFYRDPVDVDRMHSGFVPDVMGIWSFQIEAWSDPMATWRNAITKKAQAGQNNEELANDWATGAQLFQRTAQLTHTAQEKDTLLSVAQLLLSAQPVAEKLSVALAQPILELIRAYPLRDLVSAAPSQQVLVERKKALFSSWYELFPRSTGGWDDQGNPIHGTFRSTAQALKRVADMGFDTVYFPPIHPIGAINRKGKNNTLVAQPTDVGSPWAIGSAAGGHDSVHPELGTLEDFQFLLDTATSLGLEIALDLAFQAAPDHPWAQTHPEFFTILADGTIAYAENPPKKYQDIYPLNFDNAPTAIYEELLRIVQFWVDRGVRTFRVDNPHTKPTNFWAWLISRIHRNNPEVIFLAEAFTRPARLYGLAKAGFSQSYTYFTWKVTKAEVEQFAREITAMADVSRPHLFVNTPDILHASLQHGGRAIFAIRAVLAATLSPLWGVYSGYELYEHTAVAPGSEEYLDSEKFELRPRDFATARRNGDSLEPFIQLLNQIRRDHPALQQLRVLHFHHTDNDNILAYSKVDPVTGNAIIVVVNLDPHHAQETTLSLDLSALGQPENKDHSFAVYDLVTKQHFTWSAHNYIRLDPFCDVAHILSIAPVPKHLRTGVITHRPANYHN